jgi:hypothetical protein
VVYECIGVFQPFSLSSILSRWEEVCDTNFANSREFVKFASTVPPVYRGPGAVFTIDNLR